MPQRAFRKFIGGVAVAGAVASRAASIDAQAHGIIECRATLSFVLPHAEK